MNVETTVVEWREGEREGGGLYTPQGTPRGIRRHARSVPASMPAITLRLRNGNVHLIGTANNLGRTLTPSHFAPDPGNKRLAAFGRGEFMVIDRSLRIVRPISASSLQVVLPPSSRSMIFTGVNFYGLLERTSQKYRALTHRYESKRRCHGLSATRESWVE